MLPNHGPPRDLLGLKSRAPAPVSGRGAERDSWAWVKRRMRSGQPAGAARLRATLSGGVLTFADWSPILMNGGPPGDLFRRRDRAGVTVADVTPTRDLEGRSEAIVDSEGNLEQAETTLIEW